nr:MAG TPA: hypothetical protein [Caudoviricetes sp.]
MTDSRINTERKSKWKSSKLVHITSKNYQETLIKCITINMVLSL